MTDQVSIDGLDERTRRRFKRAKHRPNSARRPTTYPTTTFLNMLLDVWVLDERDREHDYTAIRSEVGADA